MKLLTLNQRGGIKFGLMFISLCLLLSTALEASENYKEVGTWFTMILILLIFLLGIFIKGELTSIELLKAAINRRDQEKRIAELIRGTQREKVKFTEWSWWKYLALLAYIIAMLFCVGVGIWSLLYHYPDHYPGFFENSPRINVIIEATLFIIVPILVFPMFWVMLTDKMTIVKPEDDEWPDLIEDLSGKDN